MPIIHHRQFIKAPIHACFDLARDVDIHTQTTGKTKEKAIDGVLVAFILFRLDLPLSDRAKTWLMVSYSIIGIIITELAPV